MKRKIIIPIDDFNSEVVLFLRAVGAGVPANWSAEALALVREAAVTAYEKMGMILEVDKRKTQTRAVFKTGPWKEPIKHETPLFPHQIPLEDAVRQTVGESPQKAGLKKGRAYGAHAGQRSTTRLAIPGDPISSSKEAERFSSWVLNPNFS